MPKKHLTDAEKIAAYDKWMEQQARYRHGGGKITSLKPHLTEEQQERFDELTRQLAALSQQRMLVKQKLERINKLTERYAKERLELQRVSLVTFSEEEE